MANKKISQLTGASTPLTGTEELAIVQGGQTVKATAQDVADLAGASYLVYTALLTQTGTNPPVATILENTANLTVNYVYNSVGAYGFNFSKSSSEKILLDVFGKLGIYGNVITYGYSDNTTNVTGFIAVASSGPSQDGAMVNQPIEIRIYP